MKEKDFRAKLKELYLPSPNDFVLVDVPEMQFVMMDGQGSPEIAVKWLFSVVYPIKRIAKERMGKDFVEPPLEGLWWADDMTDFILGNKDKLKWRMMIVTPEWVNDEMFEQAVATTKKRLGDVPTSLRLEHYDEGKSVQIMHVGPNSEEVPTITRMHKEFLPERNLVPNGHHHEIYLNDPNRVAPEKLKTVLRQPVRDCTPKQ
ncbi:MAG: GyrI-like domain-containing protein [Phycisphaerales bacterium]|nr:GyrI-like domain-containing protein [Phycisphaerales bacterium]